MNFLLFLNELSEVPAAPSVAEGRRRMSRFVETILKARQYVNSTRPVLRLGRNIDEIELAHQYPVARWRNDSEVSKEQRVFLKALASSIPLVPLKTEALEGVDPEDRCDCLYEGTLVQAFSAAYLLDGMPVSLDSASRWDAEWIQVKTHTLDGMANVVETDVLLRHASRPDHVIAHEDWLKRIDRLSVRDGRDLWDRRQELFPNLEFCREVRGQLSVFKSGEPALAQVFRRLAELQEVFAAWSGVEPLTQSAFKSKCTAESEPTLAKYKDEHSFTRADGSRPVFSWHVRFTPEPGRIFFLPDAAVRKGVVGFIGRNGLPTVNSPT